MFGFLPPSSRATFFTVSAAERMIALPVATPPVNETRSTSGLATRAAPTSAPEPRTRLTTPAGTPASASRSTRIRVLRGVTSLGLSTTVLPAARAGATFQDICSSG